MKIVGLMSGTSMDGLDIALCEVTGAPPQLEAKVLAGTMLPYSSELRDAILLACHPQHSNTPHVSELNVEIGRFIGDGVCNFLREHNQTADLIASHGQTIWHNVDESGAVTSTLQIGAAATIAEMTSITTISDFRSRDVAAGGQGAPLTAYVDWLLLRHPSKVRAVQNIGGMGNVSILPPLSDTTNTTLLAFDTGPGNVLIDSAMFMLTDGEQTYDEGGRFAAQGQVNHSWLEGLMGDAYYDRTPPKTTGRELFSPEYAANIIDEGRDQNFSDADILATITSLTASSIAYAYTKYVPHDVDEVIIGGGGSRNPTLMRYLEDWLKPIPVLTHEALGLDSDYKEALVFAVLAHETWYHRVGTMPSQTGATHATVLGSITPSNNYLDLLGSTAF